MSFDFEWLLNSGPQTERFTFGLKTLEVISRRGIYYDVGNFSYTVKNTAIDSVERTYSGRTGREHFIGLLRAELGYDSIFDILNVIPLFIEKLFLSKHFQKNHDIIEIQKFNKGIWI